MEGEGERMEGEDGGRMVRIDVLNCIAYCICSDTFYLASNS